jgi:hypothetical protein
MAEHRTQKLDISSEPLLPAHHRPPIRSRRHAAYSMRIGS